MKKNTEKKSEILLTEEDIQKRVAELGQTISKDYEGKNLLVISLLKGSFIFTADLVRNISMPVRIEFITTSTYGANEESAGELKITDLLDLPFSEYDILVVDDITDTAITMTGVLKHFASKNPKSLKACVLLDKPSRRKTEYTADYIGFEVPNVFIVGYGLNYGHHYRNEKNIIHFLD